MIGELHLPPAPPVIRAGAAVVTRPKLPALVLLCIGMLLTVGPIAGGLFSKVAAGKQMIDEFAPYLTPDSLARYDADITVMRNGAAGLDVAYTKAPVAANTYPGLEKYRRQSAQITHRAGTLLQRVRDARPDYAKVASIGGFDRVPFLVVACGAIAVYAGCVLRWGLRRRALPTVLLVIVTSAALALYPFVSDFSSGAVAGRRMLDALSPVMTSTQVQQLQQDFIVLVTAVGELDTSFTTVQVTGPAATQLHTLVREWPAVSSDLASLVGVIQDNLRNFDALRSLNSLTSGVGVSGLEAFPWLLVGAGSTIAAVSVSALPRRRRST